MDRLFAEIFCAESALVRHNFTSGTHAIFVMLSGILRPRDEILCITGEIYDSLKSTVNYLKEFNINFKQVNLNHNNFNIKEILNNINKNVKIIYIQRSRGYSLRESININKIKNLANILKNKYNNIIIAVDNCYCEFVETREPLSQGADIIAGSLIKNPGGGIAKTGGYISGKSDLIKKCAERLTSPGMGSEVGATLNNNRDSFMGLFNAPHIVGEALKTAVFTASLFKKLNFQVFPEYDALRTDIIQAVNLKSKENLINFCKNIQKNSPIDSHLIPEPWNMPGYKDEIIMASGAFISGSSLELSADAPLKEPYTVFLQGGLNFHSAKIAVLSTVLN